MTRGLATLALGGLAALLANACFGVTYTKVDGTGGAGACAPLTLVPPGQCASALLTDAQNCCIEGRSCLGAGCVDGRCGAAPVAVSSTAETIGIALLGERVIWTTGFGLQVLSTNLDGSSGATILGDHQSLQGCGLALTDDCYPSELTSDGERVYWLTYNGPEVWSVDPNVPVSSARRVAVTNTPANRSTGAGNIRVAGNNLYWANERNDGDALPGGLWTVDKRGTDQIPVAITALGNPHGVAVDSEHVYWTDMDGTVFRLKLGDIGQSVQPSVFATAVDYLQAIAIDGDEVFYIEGPRVIAKKKDGTGVRTVGTGAGQGVALAIEGDYVYWTSKAANAVYRATRSAGTTETLVTTDAPWGLALGCDAIYLTSYPDGAFGKVLRVRK